MFNWVRKDLVDFGKLLEPKDISKQLNENIYDVAFIGAGLSSTYTLIEFINHINSQNLTISENETLKIAIFERDEWVWGGIPYGKRSGFTSLIITPLDEFLPDYELESFMEWMSKNFEWLIQPFKKVAGPRSLTWLKESETKILNCSSQNIHIPRYFFGIYLWDKLREATQNSKHKIEMSLIAEEVSSIQKVSDSNCKFSVKVNNANFYSNNIMLGIGIPNIRTLDSDDLTNSNSMVIQDPYSPDLESKIHEMKSHVENISSPKIMIVGANASALEMIYQIKNNFDLNKKIAFKVLSPQGKLPGLFIKDKETDFFAKHLQRLDSSDESICADQILDALKADLKFADERNYEISDTLPQFTEYVGNLIKKLSKDEKLKFVSFHGLEIGRLQRRAGYEYTLPIVELKETKSIEMISGLLETVILTDDGLGHAQYWNDEGILFESFDILINCSGSAGLANKNLSGLFSELLETNICSLSSSGHGYSVGNKFEVCNGFYINGPLLAGNIVGSMGIWHVEHCGRIMSFAKEISQNISRNIFS